MQKKLKNFPGNRGKESLFSWGKELLLRHLQFTPMDLDDYVEPFNQAFANPSFAVGTAPGGGVSSSSFVNRYATRQNAWLAAKTLGSIAYDNRNAIGNFLLSGVDKFGNIRTGLARNNKRQSAVLAKARRLHRISFAQRRRSPFASIFAGVKNRRYRRRRSVYQRRRKFAGVKNRRYRRRKYGLRKRTKARSKRRYRVRRRRN